MQLVKYSADIGAGYAEKSPEQRKQGANLSQQVKFAVGIIPYIPSQPQVYYTAADKLGDRNESGADEAFEEGMHMQLVAEDEIQNGHGGAAH